MRGRAVAEGVALPRALDRNFTGARSGFTLPLPPNVRAERRGSWQRAMTRCVWTAGHLREWWTRSGKASVPGRQRQKGCHKGVNSRANPGSRRMRTRPQRRDRCIFKRCPEEDRHKLPAAEALRREPRVKVAQAQAGGDGFPQRLAVADDMPRSQSYGRQGALPVGQKPADGSPVAREADTVVMGEIRDPGRRAVSGDIARRRADHGPLHPQSSTDQEGLIARFAQPDHQVETLLHQIDTTIREGDVEHETRMITRQLNQYRHHPKASECDRKTDPQAP